ncbi:MAG: hypothetical protein EBU90_05055 [Proteobacteria bacterium]|nr:hypothetical protein [Pseudomonadota bacterium]
MAAFSRYRTSPKLGFSFQYGTYRGIAAVRNAVAAGLIPINQTITLAENQRLDQLAAIYYKDARFWWVLAAASDIGWGLQVPPGTIINIPDINAVAAIVA